MIQNWTEKKKLDKNALKKLLRHAVPFWRQFLLALVLVLALTGAEIIRPYIMGTAIDTIKTASDDPSGIMEYKNQIWLLGGAFLGLAVFQFVLSYFSTYLLQATSAKVVMRLRNMIFNHVQKLPFTFFDKTAVGSVVTRICNDTNTVSEMYTSVLVNFFSDVFMMIGVIIVIRIRV